MRPSFAKMMSGEIQLRFSVCSGHLLPSGSHELSYSSVRGGVKVYGGFNTDLQSEAVIAMTA